MPDLHQASARYQSNISRLLANILVGGSVICPFQTAQ
jgi:hypothetical protein